MLTCIDIQGPEYFSIAYIPRAKGIVLFARGLKTHTMVNMAILLIIGMALINFITVMTTQKNLLNAEKTRVDMLISIIENDMMNIFAYQDGKIKPGSTYELERFFEKARLDCAIIMDTSPDVVFSAGNGCNIDNEMYDLVNRSIQSGRKSNLLTGTTWGIFWKQKKNLIVSSPLYKDRILIGGIGIIISLEEVYLSLRNNQKVLWIYILINTIILTAVGLYRMTRAYLSPMKRLVKRAEEYREEDEIYFSVRKEDNELSQLSKALNRMMERITKDKKKLRSTVYSLEVANRDLRRAQREIVQSEKLASIGRLTSGIAHEIGNPIGIIIGYLELLKQKDITENEKEEYIVRTESEINRINTIIRQLLDLSRPSKVEAKPVSVHDIIYEIRDMVKPQPFMADIEMEINVEAEQDTIVADPNQLRQVFLNLIINAADAISSAGSDYKGKMTVQTREEKPENKTGKDSEQPMIKVVFQDNGPGIPEEELDNIFDPFYTTKEPGKGTGLGLWVNFMIIEGMNGKITAESAGGSGTNITLFLPVSDPPEGENNKRVK